MATVTIPGGSVAEFDRHGHFALRLPNGNLLQFNVTDEGLVRVGFRPGTFLDLVAADGSVLNVEQTADDFQIVTATGRVAFDLPTSAQAKAEDLADRLANATPYVEESVLCRQYGDQVAAEVAAEERAKADQHLILEVKDFREKPADADDGFKWLDRYPSFATCAHCGTRFDMKVTGGLCMHCIEGAV